MMGIVLRFCLMHSDRLWKGYESAHRKLWHVRQGTGSEEMI